MKRYIKNMSIKGKISMLVIAAAIVSSLAVFVVSTNMAKEELTENSKNQLSSVASIAKTRIEEYFKNLESFASSLAENRLTEGLFLAYESAFFAAGYDVGEDMEIDPGDYSKQDAIYQERISHLLTNFGFSSLLLANIDGQIVFASQSEQAKKFLGRSLTEGSLAGSDLSACFDTAFNDQRGKLHFFDFKYYKEIDNVKAIFCIQKKAEFEHLSEGIKVGDLLGVIIAEIDKAKINAILSSRAGMGETGQSYLIGNDNLLRSDFYLQQEKFNLKNSIQNGLQVTNEAITKALSGESGYIETTSPIGKTVNTEFTSLTAFGKNWALISEKQTSEILAPVYDMILSALMGMACVLVLIFFIAGFVAKAFADPLVAIGASLNEYASDLELSSKVMYESAEKLTEQATEQSAVVEETKAGLNRIQEGSEMNLQGAKRSQEISDNVSAETSNAHHQMQNLVEAMNGIKASFEEVNNMVDIIRQVGDKTEVMNSIAFKTQMLSFNASIEAARAGAAGRGFSVVAQEVGQLAEMSAKAAHEIETAIKETLSKVEHLTEDSKVHVGRGEQLAGETSALLNRVVAGTEEVKESSEVIFNSSNEQSNGVTEINVAVEQILNASNTGVKEALLAKERSEDLAKRSKALGNLSQNMMHLIYGGGDTKNSISNKPIEISKWKERLFKKAG